MYIRETKTENRKTGKVYVKHTVVESVRTEKGPRQRTVMQLGRLSLPRKHWPSLAIELERRIAGQAEFERLGLDPLPSVLEAADSAMANFGDRQRQRAANASDAEQAEYANIDLGTATSSLSRSIGPELVAHAMWEELGLPGILGELGFDGPARALAEAVVAGRLIDPGSDLATWGWMRDRSGIGELTEPALDRVGRNRVYEISDRLLACRPALERHLREVEQRAFPCEHQLFLFDLTNFHMEGQALGNSFAAHGKSKQKRYDCPL
ncbi:MAG: transposase, partial [Victivallales bacterium]|nr:transposase [Victivallales bacterium]